MTVKELITALESLDPSLPIRGTWEGITREIYAIYVAPNPAPIVLIDVDDGFYQSRFESGEMDVDS